MDDSDRLRAGDIFLSAMWFLKPQERWPVDDRMFAKVVDKLATKGNSFATKFMVLTRVNGRYCPDSREMMALAKSAGLYSSLTPVYTHILISVAGRHAHQVLEAAAHAEASYAKDVIAFAQEYWNLAHGLSEPEAVDDATPET